MKTVFFFVIVVALSGCSASRPVVGYDSTGVDMSATRTGWPTDTRPVWPPATESIDGFQLRQSVDSVQSVISDRGYSIQNVEPDKGYGGWVGVTQNHANLHASYTINFSGGRVDRIEKQSSPLSKAVKDRMIDSDKEYYSKWGLIWQDRPDGGALGEMPNKESRPRQTFYLIYVKNTNAGFFVRTISLSDREIIAIRLPR